MTNNLSTTKQAIAALTVGSLCVFPAQAKEAQATEKPNVVWFLMEDLSPEYLRLFTNGQSGAYTPNTSSLAEDGVVFTRAYSNAPVSSAARTTLITGCYAPRFGGALHRKIQEKPMPEGLHMFPYYLRQQGYYTSNCTKTDYNVVLDKEAWDNIKSKVGDWRNRPDKSKPFFFMRSTGVTHESSLHFPLEAMRNKPTRNHPDNTFIHPYLPQTDLMRYTYATIYDRIGDADAELGKLIQMLKDDGEWDNTIVFMFGDNGGVLPGTKGYTTNIGLHVPLVVRVPEKWQNKVNIPMNSRCSMPVSFMDFGPTLIHLAGGEVPEQMDGKPFLGEDIPLRDEPVLGYGDRFDELYAFNRVIYKGKYRYERNYQPYHSKSLFAYYRYRQEAFKEWKELYQAGKLDKIQSRFYEPQGAEYLFDLSADPFETANLANKPGYEAITAELRDELRANVIAKRDLGFYPETVILEEAMENPATYGEANSRAIARYANIADWEAMPYASIVGSLKVALTAQDPVERWWALTVCASFGKEAQAMKPMARKLLADKRSYIRTRAMVFLASLGEKFTGKDVKTLLSNSKTGTESLLILNDVVHMVEAGFLPAFAMTVESIPERCTGVDQRVEYLNAMAAKK